MLRWLRGGAGGRGAATTTEDRRGAADERQEIVDRALDLADVVDLVGVFGQGGRLQSLCLLNRMICGGDGDRDNAGLGPWVRRLTGNADWLMSDADIFCADGKREIGLMWARVR